MISLFFAPGFSLHANVDVPAHDRLRLERLCRYVARPAVALERLSRRLALDVRTLATIHSTDAIRDILDCPGLPSRAPFLPPRCRTQTN